MSTKLPIGFTCYGDFIDANGNVTKKQHMTTSEELLRSFFHYETDETYKELFKFPDKEQILAFGREMARIHVEAALKAAKNQACINKKQFAKIEDFSKEFFVQGKGETYSFSIDPESILNAYPKELIK